MKFKYILFFMCIFCFILISCSSKNKTITIKDGVYRAYQEDSGNSFDNYREFVEIEIKDGKLVKVTYDGENKITKESKKQASKEGKYNMDKTSSTTSWDKQAENLEKFALQEINNTTSKDWPTVLFKAIESKKEEDLDATSGVTIRTVPFLSLFEKAFEKATNTEI